MQVTRFRYRDCILLGICRGPFFVVFLVIIDFNSSGIGQFLGGKNSCYVIMGHTALEATLNPLGRLFCQLENAVTRVVIFLGFADEIDTLYSEIGMLGTTTGK
jgi:hypothetical protein